MGIDFNSHFWIIFKYFNNSRFPSYKIFTLLCIFWNQSIFNLTARNYLLTLEVYFGSCNSVLSFTLIVLKMHGRVVMRWYCSHRFTILFFTLLLLLLFLLYCTIRYDTAVYCNGATFASINCSVSYLLNFQ